MECDFLYGDGELQCPKSPSSYAGTTWQNHNSSGVTGFEVDGKERRGDGSIFLIVFAVCTQSGFAE